jgi:hypothetical protein
MCEQIQGHCAWLPWHCACSATHPLGARARGSWLAGAWRRRRRRFCSLVQRRSAANRGITIAAILRSARRWRVQGHVIVTKPADMSEWAQICVREVACRRDW